MVRRGNLESADLGTNLTIVAIPTCYGLKAKDAFNLYWLRNCNRGI